MNDSNQRKRMVGVVHEMVTQGFRLFVKRIDEIMHRLTKQRALPAPSEVGAQHWPSLWSLLELHPKNQDFPLGGLEE